MDKYWIAIFWIILAAIVAIPVWYQLRAIRRQRAANRRKLEQLGEAMRADIYATKKRRGLS